MSWEFPEQERSLKFKTPRCLPGLESYHTSERLLLWLHGHIAYHPPTPPTPVPVAGRRRPEVQAGRVAASRSFCPKCLPPEVLQSPTEPHSNFIHSSVCPTICSCSGVSVGGRKTWPRGSAVPSLGLTVLGEEWAHRALSSLPGACGKGQIKLLAGGWCGPGHRAYREPSAPFSFSDCRVGTGGCGCCLTHPLPPAAVGVSVNGEG